MLTDDARATLTQALDALRDGNGRHWQALAPLTRLSADGTDVTIDFTTEATLGAPLIVARPARVRLPGLTPRQSQIAELVAEGLSNKEIAAQTGLSVATVKDHVHAILDRLGLRRRGEVGARLHGR